MNPGATCGPPGCHRVYLFSKSNPNFQLWGGGMPLQYGEVVLGGAALFFRTFADVIVLQITS